MYAAISTRPDIAHACFRLASKLMEPTHQDVIDCKRVFRYLAGTRDLGLWFKSRQSNIQLQIFTDANFGNPDFKEKAVSGSITLLNGSPIQWRSKRQSVIAQSTAEAEYVAVSEAVKDGVGLYNLLDEMKEVVTLPIHLMIDSQATIAMVEQEGSLNKRRHISVRYHYVLDQIRRGIIVPQWISGSENLADIFTKPTITHETFSFLRSQFMICNVEEESKSNLSH